MAVATFAPPSLPGPEPGRLTGTRAHFIRFLLNPLRYMRDNYATYGPISAVVRDDTRQIIAVRAGVQPRAAQ